MQNSDNYLKGLDRRDALKVAGVAAVAAAVAPAGTVMAQSAEEAPRRPQYRKGATHPLPQARLN
jgi:hypothetical protein